MELHQEKRDIIINLNTVLKKLYEQVNREELPEVILFTNFGKIRCELSPPEIGDSNPISALFNGVAEISGVENLAALHIKNAKFQPFGHEEHELFVEDMILFTDHIIGVSFG